MFCNRKLLGYLLVLLYVVVIGVMGFAIFKLMDTQRQHMKLMGIICKIVEEKKINVDGMCDKM